MGAGRRSALFYNIASLWRCVVLPRFVRRWQMRLCLHGWQRRPDADEIRRRVDYYNPVRAPRQAGPGAVEAGRLRMKDAHSRYWFDMMRYLRAFSRKGRLAFINGDTGSNPDFYTIAKARRLGAGRDNVALMKLDALRHFMKVDDPVPFMEKKGVLIFRGDVDDKESRLRFFRMWASDPRFDLGDTSPRTPSPWHAERVPVEYHFGYRYVLALEGYDVATAVQWICASGCIPVMPRPTAETWFMHGAMQPGVHYIEIRPDFSDAGEKIDWYNAHPEEAARISEASREWARQFDDPRRESIISYLVARRYLENAR